MIRVYLSMAAIAALISGAAFFVGKGLGYRDGVAHEVAAQETARQKTQADLFKLGETISRQAADLIALQDERKTLVQSLEDEAQRAPGADRVGIGADGLQRLQQRWGSP